MMPTYLTPTSTRFLGINQSTLIPQYQYTFAVVVNYPNIPSFVYVEFTAPHEDQELDFFQYPLLQV